MIKAKRIIISAFDAGGGNAVFPIAKRLAGNKKYKVLCLVGGPSRDVFEREKTKFVDVGKKSLSEIKIAVADFYPDIFVCGTSVGETFDKKILPQLRKLGTKIIYVLDYWSRYTERFTSMPDILCVMDERALQEAVAEGIPREVVAVTGNPYFEFFKKRVKTNSENPKMALFVSQPYGDKLQEFGYNEFTSLDGLLEVIGNLNADFKVAIRPHPLENKGKFDKYLRTGVTVDGKTDIQKLLSRAGLVVGMNSMVLFQSAVAGKKVISYQPELKTRDYAVSDDLGLSVLVTKKEDLKKMLEKYVDNKFPIMKSANDVIVPNATKNIIDIINK